MNSMDLKAQLAQETQVKNQSVELARTALMNTAASFQQQLNESAQNYRADLRDELRKARESWEESARAERRHMEDATRAERRQMEELTKAERRRWEESSVKAMAALEQAKRRLWLWGPLALLVTVLLTVGLTIWATTFSIQKATGIALSEIQQVEAEKVAEIRSQVEEGRNTLRGVREQIAQEEQRLAQEKQRQALLRTVPGKQPGTIFVEVIPGIQPFQYQGITLIQAKTNQQ